MTGVPPMAVLALALLAVWLLLVAGLRTLIQVRRTGEVSVPRFRDRPGSPQWWARMLSALGFAYAVAAPLAELAGLPPISGLDRTPVRAAGAVLAVLGIAATLAAQLAMGASWRPDVDPDTRTALVTSGPFRLVRNPIFTATAAATTGLALLVPNLVAAAMLVAFVTALQVRLVEEPYLHRVHGPSMTGTPPGPAASCPGSDGNAQARGRRRKPVIAGRPKISVELPHPHASADRPEPTLLAQALSRMAARTNRLFPIPPR
jgi:protein-S-isoprenylcysteine O-methyltransferase Ste14